MRLRSMQLNLVKYYHFFPVWNVVASLFHLIPPYSTCLPLIPPYSTLFSRDPNLSHNSSLVGVCLAMEPEKIDIPEPDKTKNTGANVQSDQNDKHEKLSEKVVQQLPQMPNAAVPPSELIPKTLEDELVLDTPMGKATLLEGVATHRFSCIMSRKGVPPKFTYSIHMWCVC